MAIGIGNARLAIPHVQRPGVGQAHPAHGATGLSQATAVSPAGKPAQPTNTAAPTTQSAPVDPFKTAAQSTSTGGGPFQIPTYNPQPGQADPRDSTYWTNLSKLMFTDQQEYAKVNAEQAHADTNYGAALQDAIRTHATQQRGLGEEAMKGNLGASGWLDKSEAQQTTNYTNERATASLTKSQEDQARQAARDAIVQGYGIDSAAELAAAAGRYGAGAASEAESGEPEATAATAPAASPARQTQGGKGKSKPADQHAHPNPAVANNIAVTPPYKAAIAKARKAR